jgi:Mg2+-importing ATPase
MLNTEFWSIPTEELARQLKSSPDGLSSSEAARRLRESGLNRPKPGRRTGSPALFLSQFTSPLVLILLAAVTVAFFLRDTTDALIILAIVLASGILGFIQERGAASAVEKLLSIVQVKAGVRRDGARHEVPVEEVVPGDVVLLSAGDVIPGDCRLLQSRDLFVDEASLTGETFPVEKGIAEGRAQALFMGTHVISGEASALVAGTGRNTEFGKVSERLRLRPAETDFEQGVRRFGMFLMEVTLILVLAIFAVNAVKHTGGSEARGVLDSFLFALALAVGLTPQLLPAIIGVNLAQGARCRFPERGTPRGTDGGLAADHLGFPCSPRNPLN